MTRLLINFVWKTIFERKVQKYVRDSNKQNDAIRIERLIERVLASFNHKDQLPQFPHGIDSLTNLIYLIVDLSAYTSDERIMKTILSNYHIPFDVKKINGFKEPLNFNPIKEKIIEEIRLKRIFI